MAERQRLPVGLLEEIIESRAYARAYAANQADPATWQSSPLRIAAMTIEHELVEEDRHRER